MIKRCKASWAARRIWKRRARARLRPRRLRHELLEPRQLLTAADAAAAQSAAASIAYLNRDMIGIGARIAPGPLPHHLACGSALGGSLPGSKLLPDA